MRNKRIILDITEELHRKLKEYAVKDERPLNIVLRRVLNAGVNSLNITNDIDTNIVYTDASRALRLNREVEEINQYGKILTDEERVYFETNPGHDMIDFNSRNDDIRKKEHGHLNNDEDRLF